MLPGTLAPGSWLSAKLTVHSYTQGGYLVHSELNAKSLSLFCTLKTSEAMQQRRYLGHHLQTKLHSTVSVSGPCSPDPFHEHLHIPCQTARPTVDGPSIFCLHPPKPPPHRKNCVPWHNPNTGLNRFWGSPWTGNSHVVNWESYMELRGLS